MTINENALLSEMETLKAIADAARDFVFEPETRELYANFADADGSPAVFLQLTELVFEYYGDPPTG